MEIRTLFLKFQELDIDKSVIGLEHANSSDIYFCTPVGAEMIGCLGVDGIHFCFIPSVDDEMVFSLSPMPCGEHHVEPIAKSFSDFLSLICDCGNASPLEQISWLSKTKFQELLQYDDDAYKSKIDAVITVIQSELSIKKCADSYNYVKNIQMNFNYALIPYSDEYYNPSGMVDYFFDEPMEYTVITRIE